MIAADRRPAAMLEDDARTVAARFEPDLDGRLERGELERPELLDLLEPPAQMRERLRPQPVHADPRIGARINAGLRLDESRSSQHAQMTAHRGPRQAQLVREIRRAPRPL